MKERIRVWININGIPLFVVVGLPLIVAFM